MGASTRNDRIAQRLTELQQALDELSSMLERQRSREPKLAFPFALLQQLTAWAFDRLNRAVGRLVQRVIR
jgi:hypothetical protein